MAEESSVNGTLTSLMRSWKVGIDAEWHIRLGIKPSDPHAGTYLAIWFFFQIAADHVCLPILVTTFLLAKRVKRNPILINMCITWIIAGVSSTLLYVVLPERTAVLNCFIYKLVLQIVCWKGDGSGAWSCAVRLPSFDAGRYSANVSRCPLLSLTAR